MATIRRYPVPADSYVPERPLNDLLGEQLKHFIHVEQRLPPEFRVGALPPSPEDGPASTRYIAAVTEALLAMRKAGLTLVSKRPRKPSSKKAPAKTPAKKAPAKLALAASAAAPSPKARKPSAKASARASSPKPSGGGA